MNTLLEMKCVSVAYNDVPVVHDVSLHVDKGEILGIVGESGSGKSTLLKAAMGLLGSGGTITGGDISYKGNSLLKMSPDELRRLRGPAMAMVFQNTAASLSPIRTIGQQTYECVTQHEKASRSEVEERALRLFEKMKLKDGKRILKSYPFELSGGMNQRVGIMLAMIQRPELLLADEPTSALDVTVQAEVVKEMLRLREDLGTGIVIVTHHMGVVERMADRIAVMHQGRIVEYGTKAEVIGNPQDEYTKKLLGAVLRIQR